MGINKYNKKHKNFLILISVMISQLFFTIHLNSRNIKHLEIGFNKTAKNNTYFQNKQIGNIKGTIIDSQGLPIPGVNIKVIETGSGTVSDINGNYTIALPAKTYTIEVSYISFQKQKITGIVVEDGRSTQLDIVMKEITNSLKEVLVTSNYKKASTAGLFAVQKKAVSITDGISAEQMKQTSDNNVAQVLTRVVGVTMQENKFVVVRGMSERYNNVLLNGSSLPSTEPNRRNFSFDIIPSNLIDNVIVAKTFTPDMSGEFVGGTVSVNTLSVPQENFLTLSIGSGYNSQSFGKDFFSNTIYKEDYFLGTNKRDWFKNGWYDSFKPVARTPGNDNLANSAENYRLGGEIPNHWGLQKFNANATQSYAISGGMPFKFKDGSSFGFITAFNYRHEENREDYEFKGRFNNITSDDGIQSSFVTVGAGLLNTGWKNKNNRIDWRNLYNRRFTHSNSRQTDFDIDDPGNQYVLGILSSVKENSLWQTQLEGEHKLLNKKLTLTWFGDYNQVNREQPDDRFNTAIRQSVTDAGLPVYKWFVGALGNRNILRGGGIYAGLLKEKKQNIVGNLEYAFKMAGNNQKVKTGYWGTFRSSNFKQVLLSVNRGNNITNDITFSPIQDLFAPNNFISGVYQLDPFSSGTGGLDTKNGDDYDGKQNINAVYLMGDFTFLKKMHLITGVRLEDAKMTVNSVARDYNNLQSIEFVDTLIVYKKRNFLPSVTLTYDVLTALKFRAAYSRTLARSDFRERSPSLYYDVNERIQVSGNSGLIDPSATNYDLRLEWYPSAGEIISISGFHKDFTSPIETLVIQYNEGDLAQYVNLKEAKVEGIEFNLRKHFGFITKGLENLYLTSNVTLLKGSVRLDEVDVQGKIINASDRGRAPNGLSPLNWNAGLSYNLDKVGASINYNYLGYKIRFAGSSEFLDQYDAGRGSLDAQLSFKLMKEKIELKINVSDLTAEPFIIYTNASKDGLNLEAINGKQYNKGEDKVLRKALNGSTYSFSIAYKF
jgi:TonB-dependent receptor